jgi:hypothetical protein
MVIEGEPADMPRLESFSAAIADAGATNDGLQIALMVWTPPDGIDVPRWWCLATTRGGVHGPG